MGRTIKKRVCLLLLCLCTVILFLRTNVPADEAFDGLTGRVTIVYTDDDEAVSGAQFRLYQAGMISASWSREETVVSLIPGLSFGLEVTEESSMLTGNGESDPSAYAELITSAYETKEPGETYDIRIGQNGSGSTDGVRAGVYLVQEIGQTDGYRACLPFLISLPVAEGDEWNWSVKAEPKANPLGGLEITKNVTGSAGETDREFHFRITITSDRTDESKAQYSFNRSDGLTGQVNNRDTVTLSHGQSITVTGIPVSSVYLVEEEEADEEGYTTKAENAQGTIEKKNTAQVNFENHRDLTESGSGGGSKKTESSAGSEVKTGDNTPLLLWTGLLLIGGILAISVVMMRLKRSVLLDKAIRNSAVKERREGTAREDQA